jgi:hypothetical protein
MRYKKSQFPIVAFSFCACGRKKFPMQKCANPIHNPLIKAILLILLLTPLSTYAGGHSNSCTDSNPPSPVPPPVVVPVPPVQTPQPSPLPPTTLVTNRISTDGGQIYCSGPTAPGWRVDLPNGGCKPVNVEKPVVVHLSAMPYTGLTFWGWLMQLL